MPASREKRKHGALSKPLIVEAALRIVDSSGLEALTMRRIAGELNASPMGLYRHVRTREEIIDALIDRALETVDVVATPRGPWDVQLRETFLAVHRALLEHPGLTTILTTQPISAARAMRTVEHLLATLRAAAFPPDAAVAAVAALQSYTFGFTVQQRARSAADHATHVASLRALPENEFPHVHELAADFGAWTTEEHFEIGLDWLIDGIRRSLSSLDS